MEPRIFWGIVVVVVTVGFTAFMALDGPKKVKDLLGKKS